MSLMDTIEQERQDLQAVKRPYETAAFIIFIILLLNQWFWLAKALFEFVFDSTSITFMSLNNWLTSNNMLWVGRIITIDNTKWIWVLAGLAAYALYYLIIFVFVWNYCNKRGFAKWTWTTLVVFMPVNIIFMPPYMWYIVYIFRPYLMRFIKRAVVEFKSFDPNRVFPEEVPEPVVEEPEEEFVEEEPQKEEPFNG